MRKVRAQIQALYKNASFDEQNKKILGVSRHLTELTVKGMAMDPTAMEKVVRAALREPRNGPMLLTKSIDALFDVRHREVMNTAVDLPYLKSILDKRDFAIRGTNADHHEVTQLALHLCNELNSLPPLSTPVLAFVNQVSRSDALGCSTEDWTLTAWVNTFSSYKPRTPRDMGVEIFALTALHNANPSHALTARPDGLGLTELVHRENSLQLQEELRFVEQSPRGNVVRCLFKGDYAGAREQVLAHRALGQERSLIVGANLDTTGLHLVDYAP